jgi:hypothetical protein
MRHNGTVYRLGEPGNAFQEREVEFHLRNDGTLWVNNRRLQGEDWDRRLRGEDWDRAGLDPLGPCTAVFEPRYITSGVLGPDGTCWRNHGAHGLSRVDESGQQVDIGGPDGYPLYVEGHGFPFVGGNIAFAQDGILWTEMSDQVFLGLASYDGTSWTAFELDGVEWTVGHKAYVADLAVGPDGMIWTALRLNAGPAVVGWDGESWALYGPERFEDLPSITSGWLNFERAVQILPDGSPWFFGVAELDGESLVPIDVLASIGDGTPIVKALANATDGSTWVVVGDQTDVTNGGLYVITPEALAATE